MKKDNSPVRPGKMGALWLGFAALLTAIIVPARADVFSYAAQRRQIKACVLVMNTASGAGVNSTPQNAAPYVFYAMDRRTDVKPGGWEFLNPLAPAILTQTIRQRWLDRGSAGDITLNSAQFRLNAPITKNLGAYWEVNLDDVSIDDLQQFDVVYLGFNRDVNFTPDQREKLRRLADSGGTIWLEDLGDLSIGNNTPVNQFPIGLTFSGAPAGAGRVLINPRHPLVSSPYTLSAIEATRLGAFSGIGGRVHQTFFLTNGANSSSLARSLAPVVTLGSRPYLSTADFGAGHIVVSSAGIARGLTAFAGGTNVEGGNTGAVSGENFVTAQPAEMKVAYNIVAFASSVPTGSVNSRRTSGSKEQIGNGLGRAWGTLPFGGSGTGSGVVVHKGVAFYVDGSNILHAFDTNPGVDIDGDLNPDDGATDAPGGAL